MFAWVYGAQFMFKLTFETTPLSDTCYNQNTNEQNGIDKQQQHGKITIEGGDFDIKLSLQLFHSHTDHLILCEAQVNQSSRDTNNFVGVEVVHKGFQ